MDHPTGYLHLKNAITNKDESKALVEMGKALSLNPDLPFVRYPFWGDQSILAKALSARSEPFPSVIRSLLVANADPNEQTDFGYTSLHLLVNNSLNIEMAKLLLGYMADPLIKDGLGRSPMDLAEQEHPELYSLLTQATSLKKMRRRKLVMLLFAHNQSGNYFSKETLPREIFSLILVETGLHITRRIPEFLTG